MVLTTGEGQQSGCELSMDTNHRPDNHIASLLHSHTALSGAVFGVRAQIEQEQRLQQVQQEEQQQQMLPAQRFLEVGTS